jgi:class 3 adenylate cyclase/tetratricopeptide (TPR) repeat protein
MELLGGRDPEEARRLLDPVLERMMEAVHRYEGTVNQVMGDGIMALFGAPLAHEDHAVRACYAALRMQETLRRHAEDVHRVSGVPLAIRIGLNSGEVVVRSIGSDLRMDYSAIGRTVHLAARMEQIAEPGRIVITAETRRLAGDSIRVVPLGEVPVKGLTQPATAFELVGAARVRLRFGGAPGRSFTKLVGRQTQLRTLEQAFAGDRRRGQVVALVGEPGVGKSRLIREFVASPGPSARRVLVASALSYAHDVAYVPIIELLRDYFALPEDAERNQVQETVAARVPALDPALAETVPPLLALLDALPEDAPFRRLGAQTRREAAIQAVKQLLLRESQDRPLLIVVEDLHWLDPESQAVLDALVEALTVGRVDLLVTYRPEYVHGWSGKSYYTQLRIDPLSPAESEGLLRDLLGHHPDVQSAVAVLVDRSDGNPFFLEEGVSALVESGALVGARGDYREGRPLQRGQVPATVQALISARIDRLLPNERSLVQMAAVIGRDVPDLLLRAVLGWPEEEVRRALARLETAEFIYQTALFPEVQYSFKHALTHEVAYGSLVLERRKAHHAAVLRTSEEMLGERRTEQAAVLARHAVRGEVWDRALVYLRMAGSQAFAHSAHRLAAAWFEQALDVLGRLPASRAHSEDAIDVRLDLRAALSPLGQFPRMLECLREAEKIAQGLSDDRRLGRIASYLANYYQVMGDNEGAIRYGERALEIALREDDLATQVVARSYLSLACQTLGAYPRGIEFARANLAALGETREQEWFGMAILPSVYTRTSVARSLAEIGDFAEALAVAERGVCLADAVGHSYSRMFALLGLGFVDLRRGEAGRCIASLEQSLRLCLADSPSMTALVGGFLGSAYVQAGRAADAVAVLREATEQREAVGLGNDTLPWGVGLAGIAEAYAALGRLAEAADSGHLALESFVRMKARGYQAWAVYLLASIAARDEPVPAGEAGDLYRQSLSIAEELGMRPLVGHCHLGLAGLHARSGDRNRAALAAARAKAAFAKLEAPALVKTAERIGRSD